MNAGEIGQRGDVLISVAAGVCAVYMGARMKKTHPEKTVTLIKPLPLHRVLSIAGAVVLITAVLRLALQ